MPDEKVNGKLVVTDKIGIGIEEPIAQLHIFSSTTAPSQAFLESGGALLKLSVDASGASIGTDNAFPLSLQTDGVPRISVNSTGDITTTGSLVIQNNLMVNGNVGIGTTTAPTAKLEVNGTVKANSLQIGALTAQSISSGTPPTNTLQVNGAVKATSFQGNGATLDGIVKKAGDTMTGALTINNALTVSGNVGIGANPPSDRLDVAGNLRVLTDSNPIRFTSVWSSFPDSATNQAEISNDTGTYKTLMIIGNKSAGLGRRVSIWDRLEVNGRMSVSDGVIQRGGDPITNTADLGLYSQVPGNWMRFVTTNGVFQFYGDGGAGSNPITTIQPNGNVSISGSTSINGNSFIGGWIYVPIVLPGRPPTGFWLARDPKANLFVNGDIQFSGNLIGGGKGGYVMDQFVNKLGEALEEGDVVVISGNQASLYYGPNNNIPIPEVDTTQETYDTRVCGIVCEVYAELTPEASTESGSEPIASRTLTPEEIAQQGRTIVQPDQIGWMVTLGTYAHCKVDADIAPVQIGDLLTTSPTKGHAQKVLDRPQAMGAIVGKALGSLDKGKGKIPVLVMLQ
ncbi:MAG TPA: hypothetical protein V6C85_22035 [Allocoleopsis sp.]